MDLKRIASRVAGPDAPTAGSPKREFQFNVSIGISVEVPWDEGLDPQKDEPSEAMREAARTEFWRRLNLADPDQVGKLEEH